MDQDRKIFLHAGTLRPEKGLADACLAFSLLPSTLKESACLLRAGTVGAGDAPSLKKLMNERFDTTNEKIDASDKKITDIYDKLWDLKGEE